MAKQEIIGTLKGIKKAIENIQIIIRNIEYELERSEYV